MENRPSSAVLAAIASAVADYIATEEASLSETTDSTPEDMTADSAYAATGRQESMDMRRLVSMRLMRR